MAETNNHKRILQDGGHEILVGALLKSHKHLYSEALHALELLNQSEYGRRKLAECIEILSKLDGSEEEMICKIQILTDLSFDENNFIKFRKSDILEIV